MEVNKVKSLCAFLIIFLVSQSIVSYVAFHHGPWGDEEHFIETARLFGNNLTIETLTHYKEMSGPLPFVVYGLWGKMTSFELNQLRLLSPVIALTTYLLFFALIWRVTRRGLLTLAAVLFLMFNPYMIGFSTFVFTDMLTILFLVISIYAVYTSNPLLLITGSVCAVLSRQYAIFFTIAAGIYFLLMLLTQKNKRTAFILLVILLLSCLPLIGCVFLWKGFSPDSPLNSIYLKYAFTYHFEALFLYAALIFLYMIPLIFIATRSIFGKQNWRIYVLMLIISMTYWLAPVSPSPSGMEANIYTVGFFHKVITVFSRNVLVYQIIFFVCFALAMPFIYLILTHLLKSIKTACISFKVFLDLCVLSFLFIMPFSYLWWEKYFLLLEPILILRIMIEHHEAGLRHRLIGKAD